MVDGFVVNCLTLELTAAEVTAFLEKQERLSKAALSGPAASSRSSGRNDAVSVAFRLIFARSSHPQDKGKVEKRVQNLNAEFIYNFGKFLEWLKGKLGEYKEQFSLSRFHTGTKAHPADLYKCNVRNITVASPLEVACEGFCLSSPYYLLVSG